MPRTVNDSTNSMQDYNRNFLTEDSIKRKLEEIYQRCGGRGEPPWHHWASSGHEHEYTYGHMEPVPGSDYTCNILTDKWFEWLYRTPKELNPFTNPGNAYMSRNEFLFRQDGASVYFGNASPFVDPFDFKYVTMTEPHPLLIPAYNVAVEDLRKKLREQDFEKLILTDLAGINSINATFDGKPIHGCMVVRKKRFKIENVPVDNVFGIPRSVLEDREDSSIDILHGGCWLLLREQLFRYGEEHLLAYKVFSKNYEVSAKILINVIA